MRNLLCRVSAALALALTLPVACVDPAISERHAQLEVPLELRTVYHDGILRGADGSVIVDVNIDGLPDIIAPWEQSNKVTVSYHPGYAMLGEIGNWPTDTLTLPSGAAPESAAGGDINDDGDIDIVSCGDASRKFWIHFDTGSTWTRVDLTAASTIQNWLVCFPFDIDGDGQLDIIAGGRGYSKLGVWHTGSVGYFTSSTPTVGSSWVWHEVTPAGWAYTVVPIDPNGDGIWDLGIIDGDYIHSTPPDYSYRGSRWAERTALGTVVNHPIASGGGLMGTMRMGDFGPTSIVDTSYYALTGNHITVRETADWVTWTSFELPPMDDVGHVHDVTRCDITGDGIDDYVVSYAHADSNESDEIEDVQGILVIDGATLEPVGGIGVVGTKFDHVECVKLHDNEKFSIVGSEQRSNNSPAALQLGVFYLEIL